MRDDTGIRTEDAESRELIERVRRCLERHIRLDALILFGSRARGDALQISDWDLAVISEDFEGLNPIERGLHILDCVAPGVELVRLTPSELYEPEYSYLRCAILEEGRPLVDRGAWARARDRYKVQKDAGRIRFHGEYVEFA